MLNTHLHFICQIANLPAEYRLVAKKGEGTFSEVLKAQCIKNSKYVAIKCMKNHFDSLEQVSLPLSLMRHHLDSYIHTVAY